MHCHTKYGSIDARVPICDYVNLLKEKGYDGMLVTDHDSYRGYNKWRKTQNAPTEFIVLRGIEYDTRDAGHFLVVLPDGIHLNALTTRGMSVHALVSLVHEYGGIVGPAHPFGVRSSSAMFFKALKEDRALIHRFDFIEGFNACETAEANRLSAALAVDYDKPVFGGSDSHDFKYVGMGHTELSADITCNNDLIRAVKERSNITCGGTVRGETFKSKHAHAFYAIYAFMAYNRGMGFLIAPVRSRRMKRAFALCGE